MIGCVLIGRVFGLFVSRPIKAQPTKGTPLLLVETACDCGVDVLSLVSLSLSLAVRKRKDLRPD